MIEPQKSVVSIDGTTAEPTLEVVPTAASLREQYQALKLSFEDFCARLDPNGDISPMQAARVEELGAELTKLEDQFSTLRFGEISRLMGSHFIGPDDYKAIFDATDLGVVPPVPATITAELLQSRCPLTDDGRTIAETHRLVFIPSEIDGHPFTINHLRELSPTVQEKLGRTTVFYDGHFKYDAEPFANTPLTTGKWVLMPCVDLPGTRSKTYADQEPELAKFPDYHTATALELVTALVMNDFKNEERLYSNFWGFCEDTTTSGRRVFVGAFLLTGSSSTATMLTAAMAISVAPSSGISRIS